MSIQTLINKIIPSRGILRVPSWWMRKVLTAIADAVEAAEAVQSELRNADSKLQSNLDATKTELQSNLDATKTELQSKDNDLEDNKVSMVYIPKNNSIVFNDKNGYVQLFGVKTFNGTLIASIKDGVSSIRIFNTSYDVNNRQVIYKRAAKVTSFNSMFS